MNRKLTAIAIIMSAAGCLYAQTLDLSPYVTTGAKREILNTAPLITNLDTVGMSSAITSYVGSVVTSPQYIPVASVNGETGAVVITAAQIGAITVEQDLAALRTYHYGSPDIVESPAEWFVFDGAGTITAFNWEAGRENVVIPWAIGGVQVTVIGTEAFSDCTSLTSITIPNSVTSIGGYAFYGCTSLTSVAIPNSVTSIGDRAFSFCRSLTSITIPNSVISIGIRAFAVCTALTSVTISDSVTSIGEEAFYACTSLTSLYFDGNAPTIGIDIFSGIPANQVTNYVTDPQATGWGAVWNGAPVVRMPLYADAIYQAGELVATTGHVAQAIAAIPEPDLSGKLDASGGTASNLTVTGFIALPQTAATNLVLRMWASNDVIYASEVYQ